MFKQLDVVQNSDETDLSFDDDRFVLGPKWKKSVPVFSTAVT